MRYETVRHVVMAAALGTLVPAIPAQAQHREYYIRGRVLAADKTPIAGVDVRLRDVAASRTFEVKTDKLGVFKLAGLPHGVYEVELVKEGYRPGQAKWTFETPQETMQRVEVPDTVLFSQTQVQEAQRHKEAVSLAREAADKLAKGEIDAAMALAQDVLAKNPKDARAQFFLGLCYVRKKMDREAITVLTQVTELTPMFAPAYFELGTAHRRLGDLARALAAYDKSLELDPANADAA